MVLHPGKSDFKGSAQLQVDRVSAFVLREPLPSRASEIPGMSWHHFPRQLLRSKPQFLQRENDSLPPSLVEIIRNYTCNKLPVPSINL
jgi:hypothetical protein